MAEEDTLWEPMPSYADFIRNIFDVYWHYRASQSLTHPSSSKSYWAFIKENSVGTTGVALIVSLALVLHVLRNKLTKDVLQPLAKRFQLPAASATKMSESAWQILFRSVSFSLAFYSCVWKRPFLQNPSRAAENMIRGYPPESDVNFVYALQMGYYLQALYTLFFIDVLQKHSHVVLVHHVLTILLISFSYLMKCTHLGLLVIAIHDCCDIPLELGKVFKCFTVQGGESKPVFDHAATASFAVFVVIWFASRMHFYPLKVIYTFGYKITSTDIQEVNFVFASYCMCLLLLAMNVYWSTLIIRLLWNILTGKMNTVEDPREYDAQTDTRTQRKDKLKKRG